MGSCSGVRARATTEDSYAFRSTSTKSPLVFFAAVAAAFITDNMVPSTGVPTAK